MSAGSGSDNLPPGIESDISLNMNFSFPINNDDSALFVLKSEIITSAFDSSQNNILKYDQIFNNYYAYDDGTAEAGYGLTGTGTKYGRIAYKFYPEKPDAIIGVNIYFNRTFNDASQKYFWLNIWQQADNGFPVDTTYYSLESQRPEYENQLNKFHYYQFPDSVFVTDTFFVGWTQTTEDLLNVGFDFNNIANQNLYFNLGNGWRQSQIEGAVMIRPVFAGDYTPPVSKNNKTIPIKIYPLPATIELTVEIPREFRKNKISILIYDIYGKSVYQSENFTKNSINVSKYKQGIYFLKIRTDNNFTAEKKFIVVK